MLKDLPHLDTHVKQPTPKGSNLLVQVNFHLHLGVRAMTMGGNINAAQYHHLFVNSLLHWDLTMYQEVEQNVVHIALVDSVCICNVHGI